MKVSIRAKEKFEILYDMVVIEGFGIATTVII